MRLFAADTALFVQGKDVGLVYNDMTKMLDTTERMVLLQQHSSENLLQYLSRAKEIHSKIL